MNTIDAPPRRLEADERRKLLRDWGRETYLTKRMRDGREQEVYRFRVSLGSLPPWLLSVDEATVRACIDGLEPDGRMAQVRALRAVSDWFAYLMTFWFWPEGEAEPLRGDSAAQALPPSSNRNAT